VTEPVWLSTEDVIETNKDLVNDTGELFRVLSMDLLESAVAKPKQFYFVGGEIDIANLATVLLLGIAKNHPFIQGNKRTGFYCAMMFLEQNGYICDIPDMDPVAEAIIAAVNGELPEQILSGFLRGFATPSV
jgi:death-on-curing protein